MFTPRFRRALAPGLLLLLGTFALAPLFAPGYFYSAHDGRHSVFYQIMFHASLRDGALWPRWAMHHIQGYGYPTFVIQAPLGFYLTEIFVLLGAGFTTAAKMSWAVGFYASGLGMYALVAHWLETNGRKERNGEQGAGRLHQLAAVVAGLVYIYIPYHIADMYVRAALNDTLLFAWFPWVVLTFDRLIGRGGTAGWGRRLLVATLCLAGTLLTHTFALISFAPLLVTFVLFRLWLAWREDAGEASWRGLTWRTLLAGAGGIGALLLCATFILPLLVEGKHLQDQVYTTNTYDFRRHFVYFGQFFNPFWGFGYSDDPTGVNDGMGFQVGAVALTVGIAAIGLLWRSLRPAEPGVRRSYRHNAATMAYLALVTLLLLLVMTPAAQPLWEAFSPLQLIQFPWRLLSLSGFTISALSGLALYWIARAAGGFSLGGTPQRADQGWESDAQGGLLLMGLLALVGSAPYLYAQLEPVEPWREDGRAIFRFEEEHPDMIAYTEWVQEPFRETAMTGDYASDAYVENYGETPYGQEGSLTRLAIGAGSGEVVSQFSRGSSAGGVVRLNEPSVVRIHLYYFPGWQVRVDGELVAHRASDPDGVIEVDVPSGEHRIEARMGATPVRRLGTGISYGTLLALLLLWLGSAFTVRRRHGRG